jgi:hypothetical protein
MPFQESYLRGTQELLERHDALKKKLLNDVSGQKRANIKTKRKQ